VVVDKIPVESLIPYARNARTHSDDQVAQIAASIREFGFCNPVLIDGAKGIIAGHGRVLAARKLGMQTVPCIELSHLSENQKRAYILADNRLAMNSGWDEAMLALELSALKMEDFDLGLLGFDEDELNRLLDDAELGDDGAVSGDDGHGSLADRFMAPPFSVLNARDGWWQERKRAWLALGIQSEIGRGENLLKMSDTILEPDAAKRAKNGKRKAATFGQDIMRGEYRPVRKG